MTETTVHSSSGRKGVLTLIVVAAVVLLSVVYFNLFGEYPRDSDQATIFRMALDLVHGNWILRGWSVSADTFWTTDSLFEALLIGVLGPNPRIMIVVAAIMWAIVVVASVLLCVAKRRWSLAGLLLVATILGVPMLRGNDPMQMIGRAPMHIGPIIYLLVTIVLAARLLEGRGGLWLATACALVTAANVAGDPLVIVLGSLPILVVAALDTREGVRRGHVLTIIAVLGGTVLGRAVVALVEASGGLHPFATPTNFVSLHELGNHLWRGLYSALLLTGTNFFGRSIKEALPYLVRLPLLGLMIWAAIYVAYHFGRRVLRYGSGHRFSALDKILAAQVLINIPAPIFSDLLTGDWEARYFLPALVCGAILAGRMMPADRRFTAVTALALLLSIGWQVRGYIRHPLRVTPIDPQVVRLADRLVQEGLKQGYASYWSASITTVASRDQIRMGGLDVDASGRVVRREWNSKKDWYEGFGQVRPFFVLADKRWIEMSLAEAPIVATFGTPSRDFTMPGFHVLVYE